MMFTSKFWACWIHTSYNTTDKKILRVGYTLYLTSSVEGKEGSVKGEGSNRSSVLKNVSLIVISSVSERSSEAR